VPAGAKTIATPPCENRGSIAEGIPAGHSRTALDDGYHGSRSNGVEQIVVMSGPTAPPDVPFDA
jgi:hypothetical protein